MHWFKHTVEEKVSSLKRILIPGQKLKISKIKEVILKRKRIKPEISILNPTCSLVFVDRSKIGTTYNESNLATFKIKNA